MGCGTELTQPCISAGYPPRYGGFCLVVQSGPFRVRSGAAPVLFWESFWDPFGSHFGASSGAAPVLEFERELQLEFELEPELELELALEPNVKKYSNIGGVFFGVGASGRRPGSPPTPEGTRRVGL